jgi:hypothetical protein
MWATLGTGMFSSRVGNYVARFEQAFGFILLM